MNTFFKGIITSVVVFISLSRAGQGIAERRNDVDSGDVGYMISVGRNTEVTQDKEGVNKETALEVREGIKKLSSIPVLIEGPGKPAPQELISNILEANKFWLHPDVKHLSYTFSMKHAGANDLWKAKVKFIGPNHLVIIPISIPGYWGRFKGFEGRVDDHSAPNLITILQGVTFFGPLHQLRISPGEHTVSIIGEETLKGRDAYIIHITSLGKLTKEAIERREQMIRELAIRPMYMYEFWSVEREIDGVKQAVIGIRCRYEQGPSWTNIKAAHQTNPTQIKWGGCIITAKINSYRGMERPVIVFDRDPNFRGESPIKGTTFEDGVNNMTLKLVLGEGEEIFDEKEYNKIIDGNSKYARPFLMRIGCGIHQAWYGYRASILKMDQVWVDKATGMILREEGFMYDEWSNKCQFIAEYSDFETLPSRQHVPRHVVVTLDPQSHDSNLYPWVFDMKFTTLNGTTWLLKRLEEFQGDKGLVATAEVYDVTYGRARNRKDDPHRKETTEDKKNTRIANDSDKITAEDIWNHQLSYFQKISTLEFNSIMSEKGFPLKSMSKFILKRERYISETFRMNESSEATTKDTNKTIVSYDGQLYQTLGIEGGIQYLAVSKDKAFRHASYMLVNPILLSFLFALPDRWSDSGTTSIDTLRKSDTWARLVNATEDIRQADFGGYSGVWLKLRREEGYVTKWKSVYEVFFAKELDYFPIYGRVTNLEDKKGGAWNVLETKKCGNEGIIIPTRIEGTEYDEEGEAWQVIILEIDPKTVQVNHEVNDNVFTIQASQDVKYLDLDAKKTK